MSSYTLRFSDINKVDTITVPAMPPGINTVDTSLSLVGRGYPNYGEKISENFLHLLENFASPTQPENPIEGQLWYDTSDSNNKVLRVMDGTNWPNANGIYQQGSDPKISLPVGLKTGDIWVDTDSNQLKIYYAGNWTLVGPQSTSTNTGAVPEYITDTSGNSHWVIKNYVEGEVISVISGDSFSPNPVISGFTSLTTGTNLVSGSILKGNVDVASNLLISGSSYAASTFLRKNDTGAGQYITGKIIFQTPSNQTGSEGRDGIIILKSNDTSSEYVQFYKYGDNAIIANNKIGGKINLRTRGTFDPIAADTIVIEKTSAKINITTSATSTSTGALIVSGGAGIGGTVYVGKDLNVNGTLYINSLVLNSTATLTLLNTAASTSTTTGALLVAGGVGIGGAINIGQTAKIAGVTNITSTAISASTLSGALLVSGGVGIGGAINIGQTAKIAGVTNITNNAVSTSTATGALLVAGGVGVGGAVNIGQSATIYSTVASTSTTTGALKVTGGVGVGGEMYVGGTIYAQRSITSGDFIAVGTSTINTTYIETSRVEVTNGVHVYGTTTATSTTTGALIVAGGAGIGGSLYVGETMVTKTYHVSTLPTPVQGMRAFVDDANTNTFYSLAISGSPYYSVPVFYDGAYWRIG